MHFHSFCIFLLFVVASSKGVYSETVYVSTTGSTGSNCTEESPCDSLQRAFNVFSANPQPSLTIYVENGVYTGTQNTNLTFPDTNVTMMGNGATFQCPSFDSNSFGFSVISNLFLSDISVSNCFMGIQSANGSLQAERVFFSSQPTSIPQFSYGPYSTSLYFASNISSIQLTNCTFDSSDFGIIVTQAKSVSMESVSFSNLRAYMFSIYEVVEEVNMSHIEGFNSEFGGVSYSPAVFVDDSSFYNITQSVLYLNYIDFVSIKNSNFSNVNTTFTNAAVQLDLVSNVLISSCNFFNNTGNYGGSLNVEKVRSVTIENSLFSGGNAIEGGAVFAEEFNSLSFFNSSFISNTAGGAGGAIYFGDSGGVEQIQFDNVEFDMNIADTGAAIACCSSCSNPIYFHNSVNFTNNVNRENGSDVTCSVSMGSFVKVFLSPNGTANSMCSYQSPCGSLQNIIDAYSSDPTQFVSIVVFEGIYQGSENINLSFPSNIASISARHDDEVIFQCDGNEGFIASNNLQMHGISFDRCQFAISFTASNASLSVEGVSTTNVENAVIFSGYSLEISECNFINGSTAVTSNYVYHFEIDNCSFDSMTDEFIGVNSSVAATSFKISHSSFTNLKGVYCISVNFDGEADEASKYEISNTDFNLGQVETVIQLLGTGNWDIDCSFQLTCENAFSLVSDTPASTLLFNGDSNFNTCDNLLYYEGPGNVTVSGNFENQIPNRAIAIYGANDVIIEFAYFSHTLIPLHVECQTILLKYSSFNNTGGSSVVSSSKAYFQNLEFYNVYSNESAMSIHGADYVSFQLSTFSNITSEGNGASLSFYGTNSTDINLFYNQFNGSTTTKGYGGAIYAENVPSMLLNAIDTYLTSASLGGALYFVNSNVTLDQSSFSNSTAETGGCLFGENLVYLHTEFDTSFSGCEASHLGGAIYLENIETFEAEIWYATFEGNSAYNGSAIACCNNSTSSCPISLSISSQTTFENNVNTVGAGGIDVACTIESTAETPAPSGGNESTASDNSSFVLVFAIVLAVLFLILCIIGTIVVVVIIVLYTVRKNRKSYETDSLLN